MDLPARFLQGGRAFFADRFSRSKKKGAKGNLVMSDEHSLVKIDFGKWAEPAKVLVNRVFDLIGILIEPTQTVRRARAQQAAKLIEAETLALVDDRTKRTIHRLLKEEERKQINMEATLLKSLPLIKDSADPNQINEDWLLAFFDKSRFASDEEMQNTWAKILAGEANSPGSYSKRTVNKLGDMDRDDAIIFNTLCRFGVELQGEGITPLILDYNHKIYSEQNLNFSQLNHLDDIGLISFDTINGFALKSLTNKCSVSYFDRSLTLKFLPPLENSFNFGSVLLTFVGHQLTQVCDPEPIDGFFEYITETLKQQKNFIVVAP